MEFVISSLKEKTKALFTRSPTLYRSVSAAYRSLSVVKGLAFVAENAPRIMMGERPIVVGYAGVPHPRWGYGKPSHPRLTELIAANREKYESLLKSFGRFRAQMEAIPDVLPPDSSEPSWVNTFFSGIDAAALYGTIASQKPKRYFEIGSGNSTKFARRAIRDQQLTTTLLSIDPTPRTAIDAICDTIIRQPLEEVDVALFDQLESGDILFVDGSHHAFTNSDVVVFWLDVLPRLKPGVLVHIHDIYLPYDYPPSWSDRFYTEQWLLATALLSSARSLEICLPCQFVVRDAALARIAEAELGLRAAGEGNSFWLRIRQA